MTRKKIIKAFCHILNLTDVDRGIAVAEKGCHLIPMQGYNRFEDFYLSIPIKGLYTRSANKSRYGSFKKEYFIDGDFIGAGRCDKENYVRRLYDAGYIDEAIEYALGYRLWRETTLGGAHINKRKEAARISHILCDKTGKVGHEYRQYIRRQILNGRTF